MRSQPNYFEVVFVVVVVVVVVVVFVVVFVVVVVTAVVVAVVVIVAVVAAVVVAIVVASRPLAYGNVLRRHFVMNQHSGQTGVALTSSDSAGHGIGAANLPTRGVPACGVVAPGIDFVGNGEATGTSGLSSGGKRVGVERS